MSVGDDTYTAEHILIATGTKPIIPQVPGELYMYVYVAVHTKMRLRQLFMWVICGATWKDSL